MSKTALETGTMSAISRIWNAIFGTTRENPYAGLIAASPAASQARFHTWEFEPETKKIEPATATIEQLGAALSDCWRCIATEYPETPEGNDWAAERVEELKDALHRRFPKQSTAVIAAAYKDAAWASHTAHGGPRPKP